jgi:DNA repair exonuclease SbcCD ATPase subunit
MERDNNLISNAQAELVELAERGRIAAEQELRAAQENLARAKEQAARVGGVDAARSALAIAEDDMRRDSATKEQLDKRLATIEQDGHALVAKIESIHTAIRALETRADALAPKAWLAIDLERAEALDAELKQNEASALLNLETAQSSLANSPPLPPPPPSTFMVDDYALPLPAAIKALRSAISAAATSVGAAKESRCKREEVEARLASQTAITLRAEAELMEWRFLVDAFGRNAIQALEIDAATPELSLYANDCLHQAFDGRFSLEVKTQGETGDGREKEDLLIELTDAQEPTSHLAVRDVSEWSGGQKTFAWTAMASAMSLYLGARSPAQIAPTIVRDESAAGVDIRSTISYATMLRNAGRSIGGIGAKTLVVTHSRELAELADVILHLENGQLHVRNAVQ